jgi:MFS family permease
VKTGRGKRALLRAIVASLTTTALLAIGILLFGHFGQIEGRILMTTMLLAGYGLLALPAGFLFDQERLTGLAWTVLALASAGFAVSAGLVWSGDDPPEELAKTAATIAAFAVASTQIAALAVRRRERDPESVRRLFVASTALVLGLALMATVAAWAEIDASVFYRALAAGVVLDVLLVALQPILAVARREPTTHRLRILVEGGGEVETTVEAPDFASAAARAIMTLERDGARVRGVSRLEAAQR